MNRVNGREAVEKPVLTSDSLADRVALITGGGTGIGRAAALEMSRCGAKVVLVGRRAEPLEKTVELCPGPALALPGDIREEDQVERIVTGAIEHFGGLDILVNNAGGQFLSPAEKISPNGFRSVIRLNLEGSWLMTQAAARHAFIPQRSGRVINITLSPRLGMPGMAHSGAARAGVENLTRTLATEWARYGIGVVALALGTFDTEALEKYPHSVYEAASTVSPSQRLGHPREAAVTIAFLATDAAAFITGTVLDIDGGRGSWEGPWPPPSMADEGGDPLREARVEEPRLKD